MAPLEVLCYGELGIDNLIRVPHLPTPELAAFPTGESYHVGGAAANTALWLAKWGVSVRLAGNAIARDAYGEILLEALKLYPSLDIGLVEINPDASTPFCRVLVTPDGERSFLIFWYPQSAKTPPSEGMMRGVSYLALDLYGGEERLRAAELAREMGVQTVIGDVIWLDHDTLPLTNIATNSAAFIRETFPGVDVGAHARALQDVSRRIVITTDGPDPIHTIDPQGGEFWLAPPRMEPLDTTGAGDAFRAGLIYGSLQGWTLDRSVAWGAAAGALSARQEGAASQPAGRQEVAAIAKTLSATPEPAAG
jgi:sugar/nucleoside kinase (ribokinase family)